MVIIIHAWKHADICIGIDIAHLVISLAIAITVVATGSV
jgi:hypothetical protein